MISAARVGELRSRSSEFLLFVFVVFAGAAAGVASAHSAQLGAVAVAALIVLLVVSRRPVNLAIVAVVGVYAVQRLGSTSSTPGSAGGISYSDALVAAAAVMALPSLAGTKQLRRLRDSGRAVVVYLALLLPGVVSNPSTRVYLEWLHRLVIVGGALLVGAWIVREQVERVALRLLVLVSTLIAVAAIVDSATHAFHPASPLQLNKNFIGSLFAAVIVYLVAAGGALRVSFLLRASSTVIIAGGLLASQSRGGELAAVLGVLISFVVDRKQHSTGTKIFGGLVAAALALVAYTSIRDQFNLSKADLNNSSAGVRYNVERVTQQIWRTSPIVGVGMKYFNTGGYGPYAYASNNVIDNELAESGLIGLAGFVTFQLGIILTALRRRGPPLVAASIGVVAGQLLHGMVDIYWSAGVITLPFIVLGIALAGAPMTPGPRRRARDGRGVGAHRATRTKLTVA